MKTLLVDDDPDLVELMTMALRGYGWDPISAADADRALAVVEANLDLVAIICDLRLGAVDGMDVVRAARRMRPDIGVVILSGEPDNRIPSADQIGRARVAQKPVSAKRLSELLTAVVGGHTSGPT